METIRYQIINKMKNIIRVVIIFMSITLFVGCSQESRKIKNALKETIPTDSIGDYKLNSYSIIGTICENDVEDTISHYQSLNAELENKIEDEELNIRLLEYNTRELINSDNGVLWKSTYDAMIECNRSSIKIIEMEIEDYNRSMTSNNEKIAFYENYLNKAKTPTVFYIIQHDYSINGLNRSERVVLDSEYNITNI